VVPKCAEFIFGNAKEGFSFGKIERQCTQNEMIGKRKKSQACKGLGLNQNLYKN
tara:strand:- start:785 stop:946 length:162 start_codon:yes stop_codon:yes gene_type:complete